MGSVKSVYKKDKQQRLKKHSLRVSSGMCLREQIRHSIDILREADYNEQVSDLLQRVTTVSEETMKIVKQMPE